MSTRQLDKRKVSHPSEQFIAVPLLVLGVLLIASGAFSFDLAQAAVGVLASIAGLGLKRDHNSR